MSLCSLHVNSSSATISPPPTTTVSNVAASTPQNQQQTLSTNPSSPSNGLSKASENGLAKTAKIRMAYRDHNYGMSNAVSQSAATSRLVLMCKERNGQLGESEASCSSLATTSSCLQSQVGSSGTNQLASVNIQHFMSSSSSYSGSSSSGASEAKASEAKASATGKTDVTRCICEMDHDDGYMICCDRCQVWQHIFCMEVNKNRIPDKYYCERCLPRSVNASRAKRYQQKMRHTLKCKSAKPSKTPASPSPNPNPNSTVSTKTKLKIELNGSLDDDMHSDHMSSSHYDDDDAMSSSHSDLNHDSLDEEFDADTFHHDLNNNNNNNNNSSHMTKTRRSATKPQKSDSDLKYLEATACEYSDALLRLDTARLAVLPEPPRDQPELAISVTKARQVRCVRSTVAIRPQQLVGEYVGRVMLTSELEQPRCLSPPASSSSSSSCSSSVSLERSPFMLIVNELGVCVDSSRFGNETRFIRKACVPNCRVEVGVDAAGSHRLRFWIVAVAPIAKGAEITLPFDNVAELRYCVCNCGAAKKCALSAMIAASARRKLMSPNGNNGNKKSEDAAAVVAGDEARMAKCRKESHASKIMNKENNKNKGLRSRALNDEQSKGALSREDRKLMSYMRVIEKLERQGKKKQERAAAAALAASSTPPAAPSTTPQSANPSSLPTETDQSPQPAPNPRKSNEERDLIWQAKVSMKTPNTAATPKSSKTTSEPLTTQNSTHQPSENEPTETSPNSTGTEPPAPKSPPDYSFVDLSIQPRATLEHLRRDLSTPPASCLASPTPTPSTEALMNPKKRWLKSSSVETASCSEPTSAPTTPSPLPQSNTPVAPPKKRRYEPLPEETSPVEANLVDPAQLAAFQQLILQNLLSQNLLMGLYTPPVAVESECVAAPAETAAETPTRKKVSLAEYRLRNNATCKKGDVEEKSDSVDDSISRVEEDSKPVEELKSEKEDSKEGLTCINEILSRINAKIEATEQQNESRTMQYTLGRLSPISRASSTSSVHLIEPKVCAEISENNTAQNDEEVTCSEAESCIDDEYQPQGSGTNINAPATQERPKRKRVRSSMYSTVSSSSLSSGIDSSDEEEATSPQKTPSVIAVSEQMTPQLEEGEIVSAKDSFNEMDERRRMGPHRDRSRSRRRYHDDDYNSHRYNSPRNRHYSPRRRSKSRRYSRPRYQNSGANKAYNHQSRAQRRAHRRFSPSARPNGSNGKYFSDYAGKRRVYSSGSSNGGFGRGFNCDMIVGKSNTPSSSSSSLSSPSAVSFNGYRSANCGSGQAKK